MGSLLALPVLLLGCGGSEDGLSAGEVAAMIDEAVAAADPGLSAGEVAAMIDEAVAGLPVPEAGVTMEELERTVSERTAQLVEQALGVEASADGEAAQQVPVSDEVSGPPKSSPALYTKFFVDNAIHKYDSEGLEAAIEHYNSASSIDEQWYAFIIDEDGVVISHPDPTRVGESLHGPLGTDVNGFEFGPQMLAAEQSGRWVPYVYENPASDSLGDEAVFELKNAWVKLHDGMIFGSGWYIDSERFVPELISESAIHFRTGGLEAALAFYNDPQGIANGLIPTAEYYNSTDTLEGSFVGIIAAPDGEILTHIDPSLVGTDIVDLLGPAIHNATPEGTWITAQDNPADADWPKTMRIWAIEVDGTIILGGWHSN